MTQAFFEVCIRYKAKIGCLYPTTDTDFNRCGYKIIESLSPKEHEDISRTYAEAEKIILHKIPAKKNF